MNRTQHFLNRCHEATEFCLEHTPYVFACWPRETVFLYVGFAALTRCLFIKREAGKIKAIAFVWPLQYQELMRRVSEGNCAFNWCLPKEADCLLVSECVADRQTLAEFGAMADRQWPMLKRMFTFRRKPDLKLIEISPNTLRRFYGRFAMKGEC